MIFVVQHHLARADHYDFRLEIDGVLASWAVPKGPSLDPQQRRLAKQVDDHELGYGGFEGLVGSQPVQLWDRGTYRMRGDRSPAAGLAAGHLSLHLEGERLRGGFSLVCTGRAEDLWLLVKKRDRWVTDEDPTATWTTSVTTGRTMAQIAAGS